MSRYELEPMEPAYEVTVGWDPGLGNYFLQVCDRRIVEDERDPYIVWLGADGLGTETDVDRILEEAARWAAVPDMLRAHLLADWFFEGARRPAFWWPSIPKS